MEWWMIPTLITVAFFGWAFYEAAQLPDDRLGTNELMGAFFIACAAVVSLLSWLIWALLN